MDKLQLLRPLWDAKGVSVFVYPVYNHCMQGCPVLICISVRSKDAVKSTTSLLCL